MHLDDLAIHASSVKNYLDKWLWVSWHTVFFEGPDYSDDAFECSEQVMTLWSTTNLGMGTTRNVLAKLPIYAKAANHYLKTLTSQPVWFPTKLPYLYLRMYTLTFKVIFTQMISPVQQNSGCLICSRDAVNLVWNCLEWKGHLMFGLEFCLHIPALHCHLDFHVSQYFFLERQTEWPRPVRASRNWVMHKNFVNDFYPAISVSYHGLGKSESLYSGAIWWLLENKRRYFDILL